MVKIFYSMITMAAMAFTLIAQAETSLTASVDRNKVYQMDTLNLVITGDIEMEFSFSGLMNFGRNQIQSPVIDGLEDDFEILDQQQKYNMQSINGETKAQVTWTYTLAPKRSGNLTIPKAVYKNAESKPVRIIVVKGKAPQNSSNPPRVFIEAEVDKRSAYVQEQVLYTIRLYAADNLAGGDLSVPESNDAIIESMGDTRKYFQMAFNQRYEVRERQYLLFPQKSGELTIEPQTFSGMLIDSRNRRRVRIREASNPVSIQIKPPPASFSGSTWLPAERIELSEKWDGEPDQLMEGDSISRTLEISALGLLGSALPPIGMEDSRGLKVYPDQPFVESRQHASGAEAVRKQTIALVAVSPITIHLPEIRIPWWDTVNDVENVSIIPSRTLDIKPNPAVQRASQNQNSFSNTSGVNEIYDSPTQDTFGELAKGSLEKDTDPNRNQLLYLIILFMLVGWTITTWWLLKRQSRNGEQARSSGTDVPSVKRYPELLDAIKNDQPDMPKQLILWVQELCATQRPDIRVQGLHDLECFNEELHQLALAYEQQRYGQNQGVSENSYDKKRMLKCIKHLVANPAHEAKASALQPMYPE